jgi:UDP:flavonoid glycosyltransferase YjiC (YdhE family)
MRTLIATSGSMGDVAPFTGVAARLQAAGHDVTIATNERFAELVRASGASFRLLAGDPAVLSGMVEAGDNGAGGDDATSAPAFEPGLRALGRNVRLAAQVTHDYATSMADALGGSDAEVLLLSATVAPLAWHVAEAMGVPCAGLYLQPVHRTRDFPPPNISRPLGPRGNRAAARLQDAALDAWISRATKRLRRDLGLPPASPGTVRRRLEAGRWTVCYGFSRAVVPPPADWRGGLHVVGYWWPHHSEPWQPPADLVAFLDAGPPPVFVDFGSLGRNEAERLDEAVRSAVRGARVRAVVRSGWAGLSPDGDEDVITVGQVDHGWLMPRVAAVVHHAGAGTTAATLRAGVPSVPVPLGVDGGFWACRLDALGVSPGRLPLGRLSAGSLTGALRAVVSSPVHRHRAEALARRIADEDGAGSVLDVVESRCAS